MRGLSTRCPKDRAALRPVRMMVARAMVDTCPTCRGTWVGPDAIQAVLGLDDIRAGLQAARRTDRAKPRPCPRCDAHMRVVLLRGVEVDICPEAHGLWFDRGEIGATR